MKNVLAFALWLCTLQVKAQSPSAGNIGIGTNTPHTSAKLDITATNAGLLIPRLTTLQRNQIPSPAHGLMVFDTDLDRFFYKSLTGWMDIGSGTSGYWGVNGTHIFKSNTGNVGIGTSSPQALLHIRNNAEGLRLEGNLPYISFYDQTGNYKGFVWQGPDENIALGTSLGNAAGQLQFYLNGNLGMEVNNAGYTTVFGTNPAVHLQNYGNARSTLKFNGTDLSIDAYRSYEASTAGNLLLQQSSSTILGTLYAKNVGIGDAIPDFKLSVLSNKVEYNDNTHIVKLTARNPLIGFFDLAGAAMGYIKSWTNSPNSGFQQGLIVGANPGQHIYLSTNYSPTVIVHNNGNVGIGTTNPTYKLSVNGNIRSKEVVVESGWADYVFNEDYELPSLQEVETFVKTHKHLPNVPPAKAIEENGLQMGEMQKKMMEKIEELTLYVISLKKELDEVKRTVTKTNN